MDMIAVVGSAMIVGFIVYWCIRCCCTRSNSGAVLASKLRRDVAISFRGLAGVLSAFFV